MTITKDDFPQYRDQIKELMEEGYGRTKISNKLGLNLPRTQRWMKKVLENLEENEVEALQEAARMSKSMQKARDKSRVANKVLRESSRVENAVEEYNKQLVGLLQDNKLSTLTVSHNTRNKKAVGIIHLSDIHFNELIDIEGVNQYNFNIASMRFKLLAERAKNYFDSNNVGKILIAMTGDMLNSDRRLDELLTMSTNRSNATFLAVDILQQFIQDLNQSYNINVAYITGNESRIGKDVSWSKVAATDNFDSTIFNVLKFAFKDAPGVNFLEGHTGELVVEVNKVNVLLLHGHGTIKKDVESSVAQVKGRFSSKKQHIGFVIFGHLHSARIGDGYARSSSMAGANAYSEEGLNLIGRASQNLYLVHSNQLIDGTKIDLQITKGAQYNIDNSLEAYNCKSESKNKSETVICKVSI